MRRRPQLIPWKSAGRVTERQSSADEVVQATGWVFNNEVGPSLTLAEFVATGDDEVSSYLHRFRLETDDDDNRGLVEIGSGIGRMTCAFTRRYGTVYACDLDAGFLERCREAVARFGDVHRLRTIEVADGRTLDIADDAADLAFSYITLQHCERHDAHVARRRGAARGAPRRSDRPQLPRLVGDRSIRPTGRGARPRSVPCSRRGDVAVSPATRDRGLVGRPIGSTRIRSSVPSPAAS